MGDDTGVRLEHWMDSLCQLVNTERDAELAEVASLYENCSQQDLQKRGIALSNVRIAGVRSGLGGKTLVDIEHVSPGMVPLPPHKFRVGDIASIDPPTSSGSDRGKSKKSKEKESDGAAAVWGKVSGVVSKVTDQTITIALKIDLPDELSDRCRISKLANNITYERLTDSLQFLRKNHNPTSALLNVLLNCQRPGFDEPIPDLKFFDETLNESQKEAVSHALRSQEVGIVHGPPGTGKTYTCVEIIRQLVERGEKVLVCGPSNISVDNLLLRLAPTMTAKDQYPVVRLGHPARLLPAITPFSLDYIVTTCSAGQVVADVRRDLDATLRKIPKCKMRSERRKLYDDVKHLRRELRTRERGVTEGVVREAKVVLATLTTAGGRLLNGVEFDTILIDEAAQGTEGEAWVAVSRGKGVMSGSVGKARLLLAGDHLQLPPTVKSSTRVTSSNKTPPPPALASITPNAPNLEYTIFDRLLDIYGSTIKTLLQVQYRMNQQIMEFSSNELYEGKLVAWEGVKDWLLADIDGVERDEDTTTPQIFIDTSNQDMTEQTELPSSGSAAQLSVDSKCNPSEVEIVVQTVEKLVEKGVKVADIGVISGYSAQVALLKLALRERWEGIEIGTVDGFQGREKECIIISLVRSNPTSDIGFLADRRRMNVALTRARKCCIIVGDMACIRGEGRWRREQGKGKKGDGAESEGEGFMRRMCEWFEENGDVRVP
ncbi:hypothetical protein HDV00_002543 [Rhizophlyctis rosea]|nr:hypothetical protein HDV00_002543 [Rhizophlyctis rosea]